MEESQIIEIWDVFKDYIPEKNRQVAAAHYVDYLIGKDTENSTLEGLVGYDPNLDSAIEEVIEPEEEEDEDNYIDEDY